MQAGVFHPNVDRIDIEVSRVGEPVGWWILFQWDTEDGDRRLQRQLVRADEIDELGDGSVLLEIREWLQNLGYVFADPEMTPGPGCLASWRVEPQIAPLTGGSPNPVRPEPPKPGAGQPRSQE